MKAFFTLAVFVFSAVSYSSSNAQEVLLSGDSVSMVNMYGDIRLASVAIPEGGRPASFYTADGYRVLIFSGSSKSNAQKVQSQFSKKYPRHEAVPSSENSTYEVRAGNFATREEANKFLNTIKKSYPNAKVVEDQIKIYP